MADKMTLVELKLEIARMARLECHSAHAPDVNENHFKDSVINSCLRTIERHRPALEAGMRGVWHKLPELPPLHRIVVGLVSLSPLYPHSYRQLMLVSAHQHGDDNRIEFSIDKYVGERFDVNGDWIDPTSTDIPYIAGSRLLAWHEISKFVEDSDDA